MLLPPSKLAAHPSIHPAAPFQAAAELLGECCVDNVFCAGVVDQLQDNIAAQNGTDPSQLIPVELCRSGLAICRNGDVVAWFLDLQVVQCNLGLLLQPFTALETLSCYECDLSVGNSLDDLTTALSNL